MECPKCGNELSEGKLLCEHCGEEVKYVPDFDIELEHELTQSISSIMEELADGGDATENQPVDNTAADTNALFGTDYDLNDKLSDYFPKKKIDFFKNGKIMAVAITVAIVMAVVVVLLTRQSAVSAEQEDSYDYQYEQALNAAARGEYGDAISYLEKAVLLDESNTDAAFLLSQYYGRNGMRADEIDALIRIIAQNPDYQKRDEVYDRLLAIYEEDKNYEGIAEILEDCDEGRIALKYNRYAAYPPNFNKEGGEYDGIISITLEGNTGGTVYYTMDGTVPTEQSSEYKTPILLESGDYIISAVFVNAYGIMSEAASQSYTIALSMPDSPVINLDSGAYDEPALIEVFHEDGTKIYYTTDGSIPDKSSKRYNNPIEMPYGVSNFSFVAIDKSGSKSDVVSRSYDLKIKAAFDMDIALQVLKNSLVVSGKLLDTDGNVPDMPGRNQYQIHTAVRINGTLCYVVYEEYVDISGNVYETNDIYAIDAGTGQLYYAYKIDEGKYNLKPFTE